jgi:hypothetical protein
VFHKLLRLLSSSKPLELWILRIESLLLALSPLCINTWLMTNSNGVEFIGLFRVRGARRVLAGNEVLCVFLRKECFV